VATPAQRVLVSKRVCQDPSAGHGDKLGPARRDVAKRFLGVAASVLLHSGATGLIPVTNGGRFSTSVPYQPDPGVLPGVLTRSVDGRGVCGEQMPNGNRLCWCYISAVVAAPSLSRSSHPVPAASRPSGEPKRQPRCWD
jgi:hypothetical protein